ncbi:MAG: hypothetical protein V1711_02115 [bacterium]
MDLLDQVGKQIKFAKQTPFRDVFKGYVGSNGRHVVLPTLSDKQSAIVFFVSDDRLVAPHTIMNKLPEKCKDHFEMVHAMRTKRGMFFERFALFAKQDGGMLVGFGADEVYYVLATWDRNGQDLWQPKWDIHDNPIIEA